MPCPGWPDVTCTEGRTARDLLNEIVALAAASGAPGAVEVRASASRWRERRDATASCEELCAKVYAAHAAATEPSPAWTLALQALADDGAVPSSAAALSPAPTVVSEGTPRVVPPESRAASPRPVRRPVKRRPAKKAAAARKNRASKPARRVATKRGKATRKRGGKPKARKPASNGSRSRPRKRRRRRS
jgi:hypothetical protein